MASRFKQWLEPSNCCRARSLDSVYARRSDQEFLKFPRCLDKEFRGDVPCTW